MATLGREIPGLRPLPGMDGSCFVAVQQWIHDFDLFEAMKEEEQDNTFGRRQIDNEELVYAPASAHVKRTAQESFTRDFCGQALHALG